MGTHMHTQAYTNTDVHTQTCMCAHTNYPHSQILMFSNIYTKAHTHTHTFMHPHILFLLLAVISLGRKGVKGQP